MIAVSETRARMVAEEREVAQKELDKWRQDFLTAALGREPGSCISQLLNKHKIIYDKVWTRARKPVMT